MYEPQNFFCFSKYLILFVSVLVCNTLERTILTLLSSVPKFFIESEPFIEMLSYNLLELTEGYKQLA